MKRTTIIAITIWLFTTSLLAQVTIGTDSSPSKTMILQIKDKEPVDPAIDNTTAEEGGLVLPRVALVNTSTLEPFIDPLDGDYTKQKLLHVGLMVYNLTTDLDQELEPGSYVWIGTRWHNLRTRPADFWLNIIDTEMIFPASVGSIVPAQILPIIWKPESRVCQIALTPSLNGGVSGYTPPSTTDKSGSYSLDIQIDPMTQAEIDNDIFYEKASTLKVTATNLEGNTIFEDVKIRQINYALVVSGMKRYPVLGRTYKLTLASNTKWEVNLADPDGIVQSYSLTEGGNNTSGEEFILKMDDDEAKEGKEATITFSNPDNKFPPQSFIMTATPNHPTSYIVPRGGYVDIPVRNVWAVWKDDLDTDISGAITAEILWHDTPALLAVVPSVIGSGISSKIRVTAATATGNAVIQLKVGGVIRWSWHIWVTDYNPNSVQPAPGFQGATAVPGGVIYSYNNGQKNNVFLDRNIGAINTVPGSAGVIGTHFQWGRKDPLPLVDLYGPVPRVLIAPAPTINGTVAAIQNPATFFVSQDGADLDWYSAKPNTHNDDLWLNPDGTKSFYDPCPKGWRVPFMTGSASSPWYGLPKPIFSNTNAGYTWSQIGFFPISGYRYLGNGILWMGTLTQIYFATGIVPYSYQMGLINGDATDFSPAAISGRGHGLAVRCIKE